MRFRSSHVTLLALCLVSEVLLLLYDRMNAYLALGTFVYVLLLWLATRVFIAKDERSEAVVLRTTATGWRLLARVMVVVATLAYVLSGLLWGMRGGLAWTLQPLGAPFGLGHDTAIPNFIAYVLIPGVLLFALGAKPMELGLTAWRSGAWSALFCALALPVIFVAFWFSKGHASFGLLAFVLLRSFLSAGFSEEFLMRGMALSHLRAFFSKDWAIVIQAVLFGLGHIVSTIGEEHGRWPLIFANVVALNAPMGFFMALIALRARSIFLPGLIHTSFDVMKNLMA